MELINIGFGNRIAADRMLVVIHPESSPVKRLVADARDRGTLIDATAGKKTRAVIVTDSDHVILSAREVEDIARETEQKTESEDADK